MFKLVRYEFRKALTSLLVLLGVTCAMELGFLFCLYTDREEAVLLLIVALFMCAFAGALFVFIRGVTSYSGELKSRSRDLIFMTPNSNVKIVASKFVYTFFNGLLFTALFTVLGVLDVALMFDVYGEYEDLLLGVRSLLTIYGVNVGGALGTMLFLVIYAYLSLLATIAIAYLSCTLCHTLLKDRKWQWLPAVALFLVLNWGFGKLCGLFPMADGILRTEEVALGEAGKEAAIVTQSVDVRAVVISLLPTAGLSAVMIAGSLFGCAKLLEYR